VAVVAVAAAAWFYQRRRRRHLGDSGWKDEPLLVAGGGAWAAEPPEGGGTELQPASGGLSTSMTTRSADPADTAVTGGALRTSSTTLHNTSSTAMGNTSSTMTALNTSSTGGAAVAATTTFEAHTSATASVGVRDGATQPCPPAPPAGAVEYDKATGAPTNMAAKKQLARVWKTGVAAEGKKTRVVQVHAAAGHSSLATVSTTPCSPPLATTTV
jgi:hypothetical protein